MEAGYWIRKKGGGWLISVPPDVRRLLGVTHRMKLYWSARQSGEAVLATKAKPKEGRLPVRQLARELMAAHSEIAAIRQRDALRDRSMYAEGFAHGYLQARARLDAPGGPSAERGHRRALYRWAFPDAAQETEPKQIAPRPAPSEGRPNARTRRARRDARPVETVDAPVLATGEAREQIDAAARRLGPGIGFGLPPGVVAVDIPEPQ